MKLYPIPPNYGYLCRISNPYNGVDLNFNFYYRFKANHFYMSKTLNDGTSAQFKIACLVSHLDGRDINDVFSLIDKSCDPDKSGEEKWIIDGHYFYPGEPYYQGYNSYNTDDLIPYCK